MYFDSKEVGTRIKQLRKRDGLTQEQLAEKINISATHLYRIEAGTSTGSIDLIIEIAERFDVSLDYLVLGRQSQKEVLKEKVLVLIRFLMAWVQEL